MKKIQTMLFLEKKPYIKNISKHYLHTQY